MDIRQFKLTNDEEIICEVVEWNDEENDTMVVRKALQIIALDDNPASMRYYTFKPWMLMNNDPELLQVLNSYHIIAEAQPTKIAMQHYNDVIKEMTEEPYEYTQLNKEEMSEFEEMIDYDSDKTFH
jgi:hypothetical protein